MEIIRVPSIMQDTARRAALKGRSIGFVPTMGSLHEGHMSLVKTSLRENDVTAVSIFVNPTQFGRGEDLEKYPRDFDGDSQKLRDAGVDVLFVPDSQSMYPEGFGTRVEVEGLSERLCGEFRPGHFRAVATVVVKLLNIAHPTRAYFGQKDYQQGLIIQRLASDLNMQVEVVLCPTFREPDGLAISSRNAYLNPEERKAATVIYRTLSEAAEKIKSGLTDAKAVRDFMHETLKSEHLIAEIQYASVYDPRTLIELAKAGKGSLLAVAVKIGKTRLIDNMVV